MKESFDEYKKTIEDNVINFTYLYDGDVIDSEIRYYEEFRNSKNISPNFIINCIKRIYDESIEIMLNRDYKEVTIIKERFDGIANTVEGLSGFNSTYIFVSNNFNFTDGRITINDKRPFPSYFYEKIIFTNFGFDVYECPLISDKSDDVVIYVTDKSIQSLVYSIQNMEYKVESQNEGYKHTMKYNLYNCDYNVYKINIKDLSKIRGEKIDIILNGEDN
jgi:hypothetical protein